MGSGLWGTRASLGSGFTGARASGTFGGFSIAFATVSGLRGGRASEILLRISDPPEVDLAEVKRLKEKMLAPCERHGDIDVNEVIYQIHEAMIPVKYNLHGSDGRLREALQKVDARRNSLERVGADDFHQLSRYHQAQSMALSAGWTLSAALMRQETRGTQHREDYPDRDDKNWLRWIVIKEEEGKPSSLQSLYPSKNRLTGCRSSADNKRCGRNKQQPLYGREKAEVHSHVHPPAGTR